MHQRNRLSIFSKKIPVIDLYHRQTLGIVRDLQRDGRDVSPAIHVYVDSEGAAILGGNRWRIEAQCGLTRRGAGSVLRRSLLRLTCRGGGTTCRWRGLYTAYCACWSRYSRTWYVRAVGDCLRLLNRHLTLRSGRLTLAAAARTIYGHPQLYVGIRAHIDGPQVQVTYILIAHYVRNQHKNNFILPMIDTLASEDVLQNRNLSQAGDTGKSRAVLIL